MTKHDFKFKVDLNVINHLGVGLYSSTPAALTELVANAWDADATVVTIDVNPEKRTIKIADDGHGMSAVDVQSKFLNVGYSRRLHSKQKHLSDSRKRRVMGRKGIGKLAMFALADKLFVGSQARGKEAVAFKIDVPKFKKVLEGSKQPEALEELDPPPFPAGHGTRVTLEQVLTGLQTTEDYLRVRLARRFSVIDDARGFEVILNKKKITKQDRGFYEHVQFLWVFDEPTRRSIEALTTNIAKLPDPSKPRSAAKPCVHHLPSTVSCEGEEFSITGYIASVGKPAQLGAKEESANVLSVFANGRVFAEDVLREANSAKYYQNYLVGEIHADFLDADSIDRATASREAIKKDDPKYQALLRHVRQILEAVAAEWDEWRSALGLDEADAKNAAVLEWINELDDERDKRVASRLMTSIQNAPYHSDEAKNEEAKKLLYRSAIVGFEKLRMAKQLDKLADITDVLSPEFAAVFLGLEQVEEAAYADITRQRLAVIKKFADITNDALTLERVAQKYLFDNLWLLDPTWDRTGGHSEMEKTLTKHLKKVVPDSTGARVDISYRASSGRHVIVELKKPSKTSLKFGDLYDQVNKYRQAIEAYYRDKEPNKSLPPLDIYLLVAKTPSGYDEKMRRSLAEVNGKFITYAQLINDAEATYQNYLSVSTKVGRLEGILQKLR